MTRNEIAAYAMQGLMGQKSTAPAEDGTPYDYYTIALTAFGIADMLIDAYGTAGEPDLFAVLAMQAMVNKVVNDGTEYDYTNIIYAALDMSESMNPS